MDTQDKTRAEDNTAIFGSRQMREPAPSEFIPKYETPAAIAYQFQAGSV